MSGERNPEIQRLLASLSSLAQSAQSDNVQTKNNQSSGEQNSLTNQTTNTVIPGLGFVAQPKGNTTVQSQRSSTPQPPLQRILTANSAVPRTPSPVIPDASTITTWPAALKHVTKYITTNEKVASRIKHLISEQHKHERQWWAGREAIMSQQSGRMVNQQKAADLLKALGGVTTPVQARDTQVEQAELEAYDQKVYRGLTAMSADFDRQLRNAGIPFYAIKHELVVLEDGKEKEGAVKGRIDRGELRELQKKMLQTLEDLFGED